MSSLFALSTHAPPFPPRSRIFLAKVKKSERKVLNSTPFFKIFQGDKLWKGVPGFSREYRVLRK